MCLLCTVIGKMLSATLCLHHIANLFYSHSQPTVYYNSWSKITSNKTFWIEVKWSENDLVRLIVNIWSANGSSAAEWTLQDSRRWKKQNKQTKTKKHISTTCFFFLFCFFGSLNYWYCTMTEYISCLSAIWSLYWLQYIDSNFFRNHKFHTKIECAEHPVPFLQITFLNGSSKCVLLKKVLYI